MLATATLGMALALGVSLNIMQTAPYETRAASVEYPAKSTFQCNRIRYDNGWANGIGTRWQDAAFATDIWDMSYGRIILDAATAGNYTIGIRYAAGSYPVKVFVNGVSADYTFPDNGWSNSVYDLSVALTEGDNVFIIAVLNWGVINAVIVPDGVTLVDDDGAGGVYAGAFSELQNTYLYYASGSVHEPDAVVYTSELNYDADTAWASIAKFNVSAGANTKSIDVTYHC